jgi:hypothetical protein
MLNDVTVSISTYTVMLVPVFARKGAFNVKLYDIPPKILKLIKKTLDIK